MKSIIIAGHEIKPGAEEHVSMEIARLPSRTPIEVPTIISRSKKEGPTLLLLGGMHGDEINGVEIVRSIIDKGLFHPEKGTVVCIPILNIFGFINFSRDVPDGKDVNRSFPGTSSGSLASMVAYHLMKEIIPAIDYGIDFHTGGASRTNYPQIRCVFNDRKSLKLAKAFNAPVTLNAPLRPKSLRNAASNFGIPIIVFESGESLRFDRFGVQKGINGTLRIMKSLGMRKKAPVSRKPTILLSKSTWIRANASGLFHSFIQSGDKVKEGQLVGQVTGPFGDFKIDILAKQSGILIGLNNNPVINKGDAIMHIGIIK